MEKYARDILMALFLAVLVGLVFWVMDPINEYAAEAGIVTFLVVLIFGLLDR